MPAATGPYSGNQVRLYYVATPLTSRDAAGIEAAAVSGNLVGNVQSVGDITGDANTIEFGELGQTYTTTLPGQRSAGTQDFTVTAHWEDATHTALRDDDGTAVHSFIIEFRVDDSNATFVLLDGRVAGFTVSGLSPDAAVTAAISVARTSAPVWADHS